jgi:glucose/arabinose dehydrogenase
VDANFVWLKRGGVVFAALVAMTAAGLPSAPTAADPQTDAYNTYPLVGDAYLGANGSSVIEFAMIPGQPNEAIVARQNGLIYRVALDGSFAPALWGNVSSKVTSGGEQGLLAVAFAPDFTTSGRVYLYYTPGSPTPTVLARYEATATDLNEASEEVLLDIEEFASNHNGGHIAFDSDGLLYLSLGDGGGSGDPNENGQDLTTLLGKVIRLDVSGASGYAIPAANPFDDGGGPVREEIFAYGFRNPWRMTIDPATDDVWLGDVGQGAWEEVDRVAAGGNYGWDCYEGAHDYEVTAGCPAFAATQAPRAEYSHSFGQAVTGGAVYRGDDMPELAGWYVYGDFYSGHIWAVNPGTADAPVHLMQAPFAVASFTLMPDGEIAIVSYSDGVYLLTSDADGDGFTAAEESYMGTDPQDDCGFTAGGSTPSETWPPDFVPTNTITIQDVLALKPVFGQSVPPASARYDILRGSGITIQDVLALKPHFGLTCTP